MFRTVTLSIIRSLFTVHSILYDHITLLSVQWISSWWWTEELSEICSFMPKWICEISASSWFYDKEICYDARSHEPKVLYQIIVWGSGLDSAGSQYGLMARFCEYDSKPSSIIKAGKLFINGSSKQSFKKGLAVWIRFCICRLVYLLKTELSVDSSIVYWCRA